MNSFSIDYSENFNNFELGFGNNYVNEFDGNCFKGFDYLFSYQDPALMWVPQKFDDIKVGKYEFFFENNKQEDEFMNAKINNLESIESDNNAKSSISLPISNTMSTGKSKEVKQSSSGNGSCLTLSLSQKDEGCYDDIESVSDKDSEIDDSSKIYCESISGDLNIFVEKLLNATPADYFKDQGIEVDDKTMQMLSINKRKRKTKNQIELLDAEYQKNSDWDKQFMQALAVKLNMSPAAIYKWHWDQNHKNNEIEEAKPIREKKRRQRQGKSKSKKSDSLKGKRSKLFE